MRKGRNFQTNRTLRIMELLYLNRHGLTVDQLYEMLATSGFEASKRTIYRDLRAVETLFVLTPVDETSTGSARWTLGKSPFLSNLWQGQENAKTK